MALCLLWLWRYCFWYLINCTGGDGSFGTTASGTSTILTGGNNSFGSGASGTFTNCTGGSPGSSTYQVLSLTAQVGIIFLVVALHQVLSLIARWYSFIWCWWLCFRTFKGCVGGNSSFGGGNGIFSSTGIATTDRRRLFLWWW